ncbi:MAG TPA: succinate-semialdehyde dehydrogenase, partial [Escherichia sp.]|nr:succinate-semialdehyde dehydrogenase [Escherichia sp.]
LAAAQQGFRQWREQSVAQRAQGLRNVGAVLRQHGEKMSQLISAEMGKPILQARAEVAKSANLCDWYAEHGPAMLA